jgi:hypothetical protein
MPGGVRDNLERNFLGNEFPAERTFKIFKAGPGILTGNKMLDGTAAQLEQSSYMHVEYLAQAAAE